ncbi:sigma-70 family RNA polymerase sigma factor [Hydrogenophaga sp.]|uniref:sigma-70 family RNA polymerase sigma factor n=1 Tax=Hydrogenophaga sp. TaxID=1904254 RepID=UPI003D0DA02D
MNDEHKLALLDADRHRLVRAATRLLGLADAEDAVQDAYVRALELDSEVLSVAQAWLLTVVRNLAIDRLRRRHWMQHWLDEANAGHAVGASPSAEMDAALAQEVHHALCLLAAHLTPEEGAAVLLHEVFEAGHADIARASGRTEAGSRQRLRRALSRLRQAGGAPGRRPQPELDAVEETRLRLYLQALQWRDPRALWAMLRHPPVSALAAAMPMVPARADAAPHATPSGVVQVAGQLGLVLTLDGVTLCVLPLGTQPERDRDPVLL